MNDLIRMLGISAFGLLLATTGVWLVSSVCLWQGAKFAKIEKAGLGKAMVAMAVACGAALLCSLMIPFIGPIVGLVLSLGLTKGIFETSWGRALVAWVSATFVAGVLASTAIGVIASNANTKSQDKQVNRAVYNNMRQLSSAAEQFFLEHNVDTVSLRDLVGPDKYMKSLPNFAGETYPEAIRKGEPIIVQKRDGSSVKYDP